MVICESCGSANPEGFRFCPACGEPLGQTARAARKVVTVLFCDVSGSTALGEQFDPEMMSGVMTRYFEVVRAIIERHGGTVEKFIGDAVMAVFGVPRVREDDALRAVRAAAEIRQRLPAVAADVGVSLSFRTGVNTGGVFIGEGAHLAIGDAVNVAARLEQVARPGEIVLGPETLRLVRDAVEVEALEPLMLKGKSEPVRAFRLVRVDPAAPGIARRLDRPLVGRTRELRLLREAWDRAVREGSCQLFTLLGVAGVGKSRLVAELIREVSEGATVLRGRCLHYGEGITFWPLVEALAPIGPAAQQVLERLGSGGAATPEELFWEVRRLLESLAVERPVILHIDDLQWAEPMLLEMIGHIAERSQGAAILLLCSARPELLEQRPGWGAAERGVAAVRLEPLGAAECALLLDQLGGGLDARSRARVVAASDGNPLFLEEMVVFARERGTVEIPSTIHALLAARLEGLALEDREVLERGAVEGEVFHRLAVRALASQQVAAELDSRLEGLVHKELIQHYRATLRGDEAFRFRHLLIRDAAYDGLPKEVRADLHERFADWLQDVAPDLLELDEIAGWHLEQAIRYRRELGREVDPALALRSAERLHAAGRRASDRSDAAAARNLLERALGLAPEDDSLYARICVDLAEQLIEAGDLDRVGELIAAAERDPEAAGLATLSRFEWLVHARPQGAVQAIESGLPLMLDRLASAGDDRGLAKAHIVALWAHWLASHATRAGEEARLAAAHALRAGDGGLRSRALGWYIPTLVYGPTPARTIAAELAKIEQEEYGPYLAAFLDLGRAWLESFEGNLEHARCLARQAIEEFGGLGVGTMIAGFEQDLAQMELSAGDPAAGLASLMRSDAISAKLGERALRSTTQAYLAEAHQLMGNPDAAIAAIALSDELSATEDVVNNAVTQRVRARLALSGGDGLEAERWARSAVDHALATDFRVLQANTKLELARVLAALGRNEEATSEAQTALDLYHAKGDRPGEVRARELLDGLEPVTTAPRDPPGLSREDRDKRTGFRSAESARPGRNQQR